MMGINEYPKRVKAVEVVNTDFGPNLYYLPGGRAGYDTVYMKDGGDALYLARLEADNGLHVVKRWIPWDTELIKMYDPEQGR